ncbi:MAG: multicopper oxidase family protein [Terracidiphilus sp.]
MKSRYELACDTGYIAAVMLSLMLCRALSAQKSGPQIRVPLPEPPQVRSPFSLLAVTDPKTGKSAFSFDGREIPPVIRVSPGQQIKLEFLNQMSSDSLETCVDGKCQNMTNLHFHGLHVSPNAPQDDVISMMAMPGESLKYTVDIPSNQPPGLYWYHTHPHGESYQQSLDGMSGAIVIDGIDRYLPALRSMKEEILILRDVELQQDDAQSESLKNSVQLSASKCGAAVGDPSRIFTVNGVIRPRITIDPGEKQFWRIVNASPDLYADLTVDNETLTVVAIDGMPLAYHDPHRKTEQFTHFLLAPAGRLEAIVTGPAPGTSASLRSLCVDTGKDGDPNPAMVLADLDSENRTDLNPTPWTARLVPSVGKPVYQPLTHDTLKNVEAGIPQFVVKFTEDKQGFYINDKKYGPSDPPMTKVKIGSYVHWRVENKTDEIHPFHIHQVHFLVFQQNGKPEGRPVWMDTVNVEPESSVDLVMDFTDPIIRGMSLFHCHLLKHEDKGMMAKIEFQ